MSWASLCLSNDQEVLFSQLRLLLLSESYEPPVEELELLGEPIQLHVSFHLTLIQKLHEHSFYELIKIKCNSKKTRLASHGWHGTKFHAGTIFLFLYLHEQIRPNEIRII